LAEHEFNAIQIQECKHQQFYAGAHVDVLKLRPFPCVLSSDAHTLADLGCPGHGTHIKMAEVGLDGLKKALQDPGTRIRYDTTVPIERPKRILGMAFEGGSFDGQVIGFSDNLTALIGGRGTGKSALIEALRLVLCQPISDLPDRLREDIEDRLDFTLRDTEVKLLFADEQQGELFVLKRRLGESRTSCFTMEGKPLPEIELPTSQRIRAEIYGWSEIEELSDSLRKQLVLLDRTVPGIDDLQLEVRTGREALRRNGERIIALAREIQALLPRTQDAEEVRSQLDSLKTPELDEAFASFDLNKAALRALESLNGEIENAKSWLLDEGEKRTLDQALSQALQDVEENLQDYSWYKQLSQILKTNAARAQELYDQLLAAIDAVKDEIDSRIAELEQEQREIKAKLNALAEESGQRDFKTAMSRREELTEKMSDILRFEEEIQEKQAEIDRLLDTRFSQIVPDLTNVRSKMYQARLAKAEAITDKLAELKAASGISIEIEYRGDTAAFSRALGYRERGKYEGLFKGIDKQYLSKDYPGFYARKFSPHEFVEILLRDVADCDSLAIRFIRRQSDQTGEIVQLVEGTVEEEGGELVEYGDDRAVLGRWASSEFELVEMEDAERIWKHLSPRYYDGEINAYYDPQKLENLLRLELSDIEDRPKILLDGKPIEGLSPGQRCSALIPIILVEGQNPLVIDQPEDNLDNKLVFDLVVDILRGLKEQRQIIVATHNPNIPVSGDAEQVVVFEAPSKEQCCVVEQGSIDDEAIVQHIKTVMEGGDKAFEIRMRKYGLLRST
jgi:DNA repair ATPase RecN